MNDIQPRGPITHDLKCWPEFFQAIVDRVKSFEVRKADRDYQVGDTLLLKEWTPHIVHGIVAGGRFTEREIAVTVTYILRDSDFDAVASGYCIMGIRPVAEQTRPTLTEAQKESLLIVAEVTGDLIINAEAVESGARSRPDATELLAWAEELQQPARLLETLFDLAPKESTPDTISRLPTPADLHRTIGQARGLIQTAIGQMRDLGIPHVSKHLCSARRYLDGGKAHIESALLTVIPDPQEGGAQP